MSEHHRHGRCDIVNWAKLGESVLRSIDDSGNQNVPNDVTPNAVSSESESNENQPPQETNNIENMKREEADGQTANNDNQRWLPTVTNENPPTQHNNHHHNHKTKSTNKQTVSPVSV